jgi:hypothetical protein
MTKNVGLWIDHKKAMVVTMLGKGEDIKEIKSEVEQELETSTDDHRQSAATGHLNIYYDAVIDCLRDADSILIFGSGEAKQELRKRLEKDKKLGDRIVDVLTTDKMTDPQIAAKVREYFHDNPKHTKERN